MAKLTDIDMLTEIASDMRVEVPFFTAPRERALLILIYELNHENRELKQRVTELERQWRKIAKEY